MNRLYLQLRTMLDAKLNNPTSPPAVESIRDDCQQIVPSMEIITDSSLIFPFL